MGCGRRPYRRCRCGPVLAEAAQVRLRDRRRTAKEMFRLQRERLEAQFFQAAAQSGKPRGLTWKACDFEDEVRFVRERATNQIAALVAVSISFEAIPAATWKACPPSATCALAAPCSSSRPGSGRRSPGPSST